MSALERLLAKFWLQSLSSAKLKQVWKQKWAEITTTAGYPAETIDKNEEQWNYALIIKQCFFLV